MKRVMQFICLGMLGLFLMLQSANTVAEEDHLYRICNSCSTEADYIASAKIDAPIGKNVVVMNLQTRVAKAYRVYYESNGGVVGRNYPDPGGVKTDVRPVPSDVMPAINGYHDLIRAFEEHRRAIGIRTTTDVNNDIHINNRYNGCGTNTGPSAWSYPYISDFPFVAACNAHDICWGSGQSKGMCDEAFRFNMQETVNIWRNLPLLSGRGWLASKVGIFLYSYSLELQAEVYFMAVNGNLGQAGYCLISVNRNRPECYAFYNGGMIVGDYLGNKTGSTTGNNGTVLGWTCETWRFPNGNGGHYLMERNCQFRRY